MTGRTTMALESGRGLAVCAVGDASPRGSGDVTAAFLRKAREANLKVTGIEILPK